MPELEYAKQEFEKYLQQFNCENDKIKLNRLMKKNIPLEKTREYFLPRGYHMFTILLQVSGLLCLPLSVVP